MDLIDGGEDEGQNNKTGLAEFRKGSISTMVVVAVGSGMGLPGTEPRGVEREEEVRSTVAGTE